MGSMNAELRNEHCHWLTILLCCLFLSAGVFRKEHPKGAKLKSYSLIIESSDKSLATISTDSLICELKDIQLSRSYQFSSKLLFLKSEI